MPTVLVLGARSDIAAATARRFAADGFDVQLAARDLDALTRQASDLSLRFGVQVQTLQYDALSFDAHTAWVGSLAPLPDVVVFAVGFLGAQAEAEQDFAAARRIVETNYLSAISVLEPLAAAMAARGSGAIIGISSVAGDRGRKSNYLYGSAKAALSAYLSGLRNRLFAANVHVLTVKPGFVRTAMTVEMELPAKLTATPEAVAEDIYGAWRKQKDILYTRWYWRYIMLIIRNIPERIFKRLSL
jgi:short-subunit dehydrogenase